MKRSILVLIVLSGALGCGSISARAQGVVNKNAGWSSEWTKDLNPYEAGAVVPRAKFIEAYKKERYKTAFEIAQRWTQSQPSNSEAWDKFGMAAFAVEQWAVAEDAASRVLAAKDLAPEVKSNVLSFRANCRGKLKDYRGAATDFRAAVQSKPGAWTLNDFAWLLATCPDTSIRNGSEAVALAAKAVRIGPSVPHFADTLAAAYAELGDFDNAVAWQEKAQKLETRSNRLKNGGKRLKVYKSRQPYRDAG